MHSYNKPDITASYLRHKEINEYLKYLSRRYADFVTVYTIGHSYEGRKMKAIEIDWHKNHHPPSNQQCGKRNMVFIEAGTHAREWMTIAVALKCVQQLTEKHGRHQNILEKLRFFIVPLANPDGYEYTFYKNPMWRKNRRPQNTFIGTDCNRNFDFQWDSGLAKKSTFKGEKPFSEPETCALRNWMEKLRPQLLLFISLHSYGQAIMYPWGYTRELPISWKQHQQVADCGRRAIKKVSGRIYRCGSISGIRKHIYPGSIIDYAYGSVKVPFAIVVELPSSVLGFQPLSVHIRPIGHESWIGIRAMCQKVLEISSLSSKLGVECYLEGNQNQDTANREMKTESVPVSSSVPAKCS